MVWFLSSPDKLWSALTLVPTCAEATGCSGFRFWDPAAAATPEVGGRGTEGSLLTDGCPETPYVECPKVKDLTASTLAESK